MNMITILAVVGVSAALTTGAFAQQGQSAYGAWSNNAPPPPSGTWSNPNSVYVAPHVNSDGTYVQGHRRSEANDTKLDNWSTKGNVNPYTGKSGTKDPWR